MKITSRHLRQLIREELMSEKRYLRRIDAVADVQQALNTALKGEAGYVPLEVDKQWGQLTDAAWFKFVDKFYEPEVGGPSNDDVKNRWEMAGAELGFDNDEDGVANAGDAADFIRANTPATDSAEEAPETAAALPADAADTDGDGRVSDDELISAYGSSALRGTRLAGQHPWRLANEPDSLPANLTLDKFPKWSYIISYEGADYAEAMPPINVSSDITPAQDKEMRASFAKDPASAWGEVTGDKYTISTYDHNMYEFTLNDWLDDNTPESLRRNKFMYSLVVAQSMKGDSGSRPVFKIWADDGQLPAGDTDTYGFTIKTLKDFNRFFGSATNESTLDRWSKLAGILRS